MTIKETINNWFKIEKNITLLKFLLVVFLIILLIVLVILIPEHEREITGTIGGILFFWLLFVWVKSKQK